MLSVERLTKSFGPQRAVDDVSFAVAPGQVLALLGPSGSGKSTLLSLIAGLEPPDAGDVRWDGHSLQGVPTHRRGFGLMFQDYALFPHKDVAENIGFGLKLQGRSRADVEAGIDWALKLVGLDAFGPRDVSTLSGGEQQRVALARALAPHPRLLMLDEPLGALDRTLRERLLDELHAILERLQQTAIYVTHDQEEAFAMAGQVVILRQGRVVQQGAPADVYARPASRFVAEFLGLRNLLAGRLERQAGRLLAVTPAGAFALADGSAGLVPGRPLTVLLRPDGAAVAAAGDFDLEGEILDTSFRGRRRRVVLRAGGLPLTFELPAAEPLPAVGQPLRLRLGPSAVQAVMEDDG